jgi:hemolysin activation/secretion protein
VQKVQVLGSTVFSPEELAKLVSPFEGQDLTFEQLLEIRTVVTRFYTDRGYATSGAFLPAQDLTSGVVTIQVVEGELEQVDIQGLGRLRDSYVRGRILRAAEKPLNIRSLETALQLLQQNPLFSAVQAELKAGTTPGRSVLALTLKEAPALHGVIQVENRDSPTVGSIRGTAILSHQNLLGFGDRLALSYGRTTGINDYNVDYEFPINASDGVLALRYNRSDSRIVNGDFANIDGINISSDSETISIGVRQPLIRTPNNEFTLGLTLDFRESQTFLTDGVPFSFSVGPDNGNSKVSVIRFSQDWINRTSRRVFAARSQFSLGINAFGATINETGTDGRFLSWVGQFQWVQAIGDVIAIGRIAAQLTPDSLLPLEQFSLGGVDTVRGYRQNQRVGDNGITGSLEIRVPIVRQPQGIGTIQLAPFFDVGTIWSNSGTLPSPTTLVSAGIGLRWQLDPYFSARLDWGIPLNSVDRQGRSLQDDGIFFSIRLQLF